MKRFLPLVALLPAFACTPDIAQDGYDSNVVVVNFDPAAAVPVVPAPNDLAKNRATGKLAIPSEPNASAAQKEFNDSYLNTLDGFPFESTGSVTVSAELNPASVTPLSVIALDITNAAAPTQVAIAPAYANKTIKIPPPATGWLKGHSYAVALNSGTGGLTGAQGQKVIGSSTWSLISGTSPLVTCPDLKTNCAPAIDVIPSRESDPAAKLADQTSKALQLEQLRLAYKPLLDGLALKGLPRESLPIVWTFSIVTQGEVLFDPAHNVIPFPNDILRSPTTGLVTLPNPKTFAPLTAADCAGTDPSLLLVCGLNTLNGWSTTVPLVSENSATLGAAEQSSIDKASLSLATVGLTRLRSTAPAAELTTPHYVPCLNCASSDPTSTTAPQQLQWNLLAPLDEESTYFAYVTTDVKDTEGKNLTANPLFALVRSAASLVTADGHAAVSILSDDQAKQLEPLRAAMAPAFDAIAAKGLPREKIALAFAFTTQSEATDLDKLRAAPAAATAKGLPDYPVLFNDVTAVYQQAAGEQIPIGNVSKFYAGAFYSPVAVVSAAGTFNPGLAGARPLPVPFVMSVPQGEVPAGGWPVTIFGHGLTRSRNDFLPIANALSQAGQIVIAIDGLDHGERTTCTGSLAAIKALNPAATSDDAACQNPTTMRCDEDPVFGICVLRDGTGTRAACTPGPTGDLTCSAQGQGRCAADSKCQGIVNENNNAPTACNQLNSSGANPNGSATCAAAGLGLCGGQTGNTVCTGSPAQILHVNGSVPLSGFNLFSITNFFSTRDNFRQQVIDLQALVNVLKSGASTNLAAQLGLFSGGATTFNPARINYVGQSLGGILGTLFNAVSPDTTNVALNVGGGALTKLFLDSPTLAPQKAVLVSVLASQGIKAGTPEFDQFIGLTQMILDPADPTNMAYKLTHGSANPNRKAFLQFIKDDQFVINESNFALLAGANRSLDLTKPPSFNCQAPLFCYEFIDAIEGFDTTSLPLANRHGFLLNGSVATAKAQTQIATFIAAGVGP